MSNLSLLNPVAGKGIVAWHITDISGTPITIELPCCHIINAPLCLLSPQILRTHFGGTTTQSATNLTFMLGKGVTLTAQYCLHSRLPCLPTPTDPFPHAFWTIIFDYKNIAPSALASLISASNSNLTAAQKEVLLWHQRLSHATPSWVQASCDLAPGSINHKH